MSGPQIAIAITGASGAAYALRLVERLAKSGAVLHLIISDAARVVMRQELDVELPAEASELAGKLAEHLQIDSENVKSYALDDWFAPVASGSAGIRRMVVIPCSMGTLARIAGGVSDNLLERAADVLLKERGRLILVPRETPLSSIHLEHMLKLSNMGVHIIPAMPGFYHRPASIDELVDFVVDRVLDHLELPDSEVRRWGE